MQHRGLLVENIHADAIKPASIDLYLSNHFWRIDGGANSNVAFFNNNTDIDLKEDQSGVGHEVTVEDGDYYRLAPGEFVLASTRERFHFPRHLAGRLDGKSSLGRLGLMVHTTAGFFDPGFVGYPTLELVNMRQRPMRLYPGMPVAQMSVFEMTSPAEVAYNEHGASKYADQGAKPAPSKFHLNLQGV
jgi:dCTP deaminase